MLRTVPLLLTVATASAAGPYPSSRSPMTSVLAVADAGRSQAEKLCLDTLAGNLARETPRIYRVDSTSWRTAVGTNAYHQWLRDLSDNHHVSVDEGLISSPLQTIVAHFSSALFGYVRSNSGDASTSAAITFAAAGHGLLVAADGATASALEAAGLSMTKDVRGRKVADIIHEVLPQLSDKIFVFQDPRKMDHLGDYAVFAQAAYLAFGSETQVQQALLSRAKGPAAAFGWGPENDFVRTVNQYGVYVHASDWNLNLAALTNAGPGRVVPKALPQSLQNITSDVASVHTVTFLMSDGDNLQWTLGGWSVDSKWYGSPKRGSVPIGWTFSPSAFKVAPSALRFVLSSMTDKDELVAGPSGVGYMFPTEWPTSLQDEFASLTWEGMSKANMRVVNALGVDDNVPSDGALAPLLGSSDVDAIFYYGWGTGYASLHGRSWWIGGKPVISGRYSLWGEGAGDMCGVQPMIEKLKAMSKDPSSPEGYSVIPVNAWSHTYDDVVAIAEALAGAGGVDVVLPSELVRRFKANVVPPSAVTCLCDHPGGSAPDNHYTCSDSSKSGYCASNQRCAATGEWEFPPSKWDEVCPGSAVTCRCDKPGGSAPDNHYTCSDSSKGGYCASNQRCAATGEWEFPPSSWDEVCPGSATLLFT